MSPAMAREQRCTTQLARPTAPCVLLSLRRGPRKDVLGESDKLLTAGRVLPPSLDPAPSSSDAASWSLLLRSDAGELERARFVGTRKPAARTGACAPA